MTMALGGVVEFNFHTRVIGRADVHNGMLIGLSLDGVW